MESFFIERGIDKMNINLQIGLGLLPGIVVALVLFIKRRAFNLNKILILLLLTVICGTNIIYGGSDLLANISMKPKLSQKDMISFANALVLEGAYPEAKEVINQYSKEYGYDEDCSLLNARL